MKKLFAVLLLASFALSGCSANTETAETAPQAPAVSQAETAAKPGDSLDITFFKFGDADSILLETGGKAMLIDTGEKNDGGKLTAVLKDRQISRLDCLIITHFDKDHVGGAADVLNAVTADKVYQPDYPCDSKQFAAYLSAAAERGITPSAVTGKTEISFGSAEIKLITPKYAKTRGDNDMSIITELYFGEKSFLFAGDAESTLLSEYLETAPHKFDFLKVPHHGRVNETSERFINAVSPQFAVICCKKDETGSAHAVQKLLETVGAQVYFTYNGIISLSCSGDNITVKQ